MANLSNINNKFLVTTGGNVLIGQTGTIGSSIFQVTGNSTFAGMITVNGGGIDIDNNDDVRLRFDNAATFKAGLQVATTAGDMIAGSAVNDFAIRSQENMLFATGGNTERMRIDSSGKITIGTGVINPSIGSDIAITQGSIGLRINDAASALSPTTATSNNDNAVDLGVSNIRFRNLYMGGTGIFGGNVTVNSGNKLILNRTDNAIASELSSSSTGKLILNSLNGEGFDLQNNGTSILLGDSSGNVGLGDIPSFKLDVNVTSDRARFKAATGDANIELSSIAGHDWLIQSKDSSSFAIYDEDASAERMRIDSNGYVTIKNNAGVDSASLTFSNSDIGIGINQSIGYLNFYSNDSSTSSLGGVGGISVKSEEAFNTSFTPTYMSFYTHARTANNGTSLGNVTERMRIDSSGNVGIGTDSPLHNLQIGTAATNGSYSMMIEGNFANNALASNPRLNLIDTNFGITAGKYGSGGADDALGIFAFQGAGRGILFAHTTAGSGTHLKDMRHDMFIDGGTGNVGIGTNSPSTKLHVDGTNTTVLITEDSEGEATLRFGDTQGNLSQSMALAYNTSNGLFTFTTNGTSERMSITSGGNVEFKNGTLKVGDSTTAELLIIPSSDGFAPALLQFHKTDTASQTVLQFLQNNIQKGSITYSGASTSFNTTSDYRLKEDLQDFAGLDMVSKIPVYDFKWKSDKSRGYGVIAHELQEVLPDAVSGEKDDEQMQGVDYSKIVPLLIKSIQELKAEIELLKSK